MNSIYNAPKAHLLLSAARKFSALLCLSLIFGTSNAAATTYWQFGSGSEEGPADTGSLFSDNPDNLPRLRSAVEQLFKSISAFDKEGEGWSLAGFLNHHERKAPRYLEMRLGHGGDKWMKDRFKHEWEGNGWGHLKEKHRDKHSPVVPIPATAWLFGSGLVFLGIRSTRRKYSN